MAELVRDLAGREADFVESRSYRLAEDVRRYPRPGSFVAPEPLAPQASLEGAVGIEPLSGVGTRAAVERVEQLPQVAGGVRRSRKVGTRGAGNSTPPG
ncbi:MAG: hypothetical protein QOJ37_3851 [Pseudonocardiales bacterium]|nr:hypothetical protein [Pseudonocardiales bacterium]